MITCLLAWVLHVKLSLYLGMLSESINITTNTIESWCIVSIVLCNLWFLPPTVYHCYLKGMQQGLPGGKGSWGAVTGTTMGVEDAGKRNEKLD